MSRLVVVPDTNFFISNPRFVPFFAAARVAVHFAIPLPVLKELDGLRRRWRTKRSTKDVERGRAAREALAAVLAFQKEPPVDFDYEVVRSDRIRPDEEFDVQISDYAIHTAQRLHREDSVIFATDDRGLPTLLVNAEIHKRKMENLRIMTAEQLKAQLPTLGKASAEIQHVGVRLFQGEHGFDGIALYVTSRTQDLKSVPVSATALFYNGDGEPIRNLNGSYRTQTNQLAVQHVFTPARANWVERHIRLFIPFAEFEDTARRRYGVHRIKFAIELSASLDGRRFHLLARAAAPSYVLQVALRQWSCAEELLRRAA